jgi:glutamyl-tRNA reductase
MMIRHFLTFVFTTKFVLATFGGCFEVRERLAVAKKDWNAVSADLVTTGAIAEAAVLSTCNQFEVYYAATDPREAMAAITSYLSKRGDLPVSVLRKSLFMLSGDDAV